MKTSMRPESRSRLAVGIPGRPDAGAQVKSDTATAAIAFSHFFKTISISGKIYMKVCPRVA